MTALETAYALIERGDMEAVARLVEAAWYARDQIDNHPDTRSVQMIVRVMLNQALATLPAAKEG